MRVLVVYDIPHDRIRTKVADICADYGLDRIQYSAFAGELERVYQEELMKRVRRHLGKRPGKIVLYPLCDRDWHHRIEIIQEGTKSDAGKGK